MRILLGALALFAPVAHAAPSSGLADTDTLFVGYAETWSADFPANHEGEVAEVCVVAAEPSHVRATSNSWRIARTSSNAGPSMCEYMLHGDAAVIVKTFPAEQIHDAFFNSSTLKGLPRQRTFDGRVSGKEINDAVVAASAKCKTSGCIVYLEVAKKMEGWGVRLPLNQQGDDIGLDPMGTLTDTAGAFSLSNFYVHHVGN